MKMRNKNYLILVITLIISICVLLASCFNPLGEREYLDDLYIDIPDTEYQLLIKEWQYLLGSGAEVYFVDDANKKTIHLGNTSGGDDGFCPFQSGKYSIAYNEGTVTLCWSLNGSENYTQSESFILPSD